MDVISQVLREARTIAVVGLSENPARPAYEVARYLQQQGYQIIPVNPTVTQALGEKAYPSLDDVPGPVDIVDIFRNPQYVPEIVQQAIRKKARVVWMQPGAENWDAADVAEAAGLTVIVGQCMRTEHSLRG